MPYTKEQLQVAIRFHKDLKRDYAKMYHRWELTKNADAKEGIGKRLLVKAAHLGKLSDEIKELMGNKN